MRRLRNYSAEISRRGMNAASDLTLMKCYIIVDWTEVTQDEMAFVITEKDL